MGYQDRDWYKDHHKEQERARSRPSSEAPASNRRVERVGPRPGRPVEVRAKSLGFLSRILSASAWKIAIFWVAVAVGLTFVFEPVASTRAAKRVIEPAVKLFCSPGAKCT